MDRVWLTAEERLLQIVCQVTGNKLRFFDKGPNRSLICFGTHANDREGLMIRSRI